MSPSQLLALYAVLVVEIGELLELAPERLARAEALDRLEITTRVTLERMLFWNTSLVERWFALLGDDLELDLYLGGLDAESNAPGGSLRAGRDPQGTLQQFIQDVHSFVESHGNEVDVEVRLSIAKTRAVATVQAWLSTRPEYPGSSDLLAATTALVFYQAGSLDKLLRFGALLEWERRGLAQAKGRTVIVLGDATGYLAGISLEILGARQAGEPHWLAFSRSVWREFLERTQQVRQLHRQESNWPGAPAILTPAHLQLREYASGLEAVALQVEEVQAALAACYLAGSITGEANQGLWLRFAGPRPAVCHLGAAEKAGVAPAATSANSAGDELARLAAWAYRHSSADKLAIARESLAHELPAGGQVTLASLKEAAPAALEAAKANFTLYLRGNTAQYFQLRQQALDMVTSYAANLRKAVSDLTDDVVQNVYRTIGLLIGVVIAGLIQPKLALTVQQIAAAIYVVYLLFLVYFLLGSRRQRFQLEASDLQIRLSAMPELSESERWRLRAEAGSADHYFEQYFYWSQLIYLALAAASALYFLLLFTPLATHLPLALPPPTQPTSTPVHH